MPSAPHETMVVLLREHPDWLGALVEVIAKRKLPAKLTVADSAVRVLDPAEVRLDLVLTAEDGLSWVLVEVQLDEDRVKARKWPLAVAALWNERGVPGDLLVITADRAVAAWTQTVGQMDGPLGGRLAVRPVVVQLTGDVAEALLNPAHPELAFFAAWTVHDRYGVEAQAIVERATDLIETIPDEALRRTLLRRILGMLHEKLVALIREVSMDSQKIPVSPALQRLGEEFQAMYGAQLEARGKAQGEAHGRVRGEAEALLKFLDARGFVVEEARRAEVLACEDVALLDRWIKRAASVATIDEVFAVGA